MQLNYAIHVFTKWWLGDIHSIKNSGAVRPYYMTIILLYICDGSFYNMCCSWMAEDEVGASLGLPIITAYSFRVYKNKTLTL